MTTKKVLALTMLALLLFSSASYAHPGRTDSNGGHTCRTNCEKWGLEYGEYHYHNGGGSSSSSDTDSTLTPAPNSAPPAPKEKIPDGSVTVQLPLFDLYVNGQQIVNDATEYPVILYNDITYFPMTWNYTQALALETKWDAEVGFVVRKTDNEAGALDLDWGTPSSKLYAKLPAFNVYVNDAWIDNAKEPYPILVLNDITYFPMTWKFAVEELGLTMKFENDAFYISK